MMVDDDLLRRLEGLHTIETLAKALGMGRQSAINFASRLRKQGYLSSSGGGKQPRFYKITARKQRERVPGMFDILNKHSPQKLSPWYDHQVHGRYGVEEALVDAVKTGSFRAILASLSLFNHVKDWPRLHRLADDNGCWQKVGALYDAARMHLRVKRMPERYRNISGKEYEWVKLTSLENRDNFSDVQQKWHVYIPFNEKDLKSWNE
ncbi:MAG: hypothetical protein V1866_06450 [archaeon]